MQQKKSFCTEKFYAEMAMAGFRRFVTVKITPSANSEHHFACDGVVGRLRDTKQTAPLSRGFFPLKTVSQCFANSHIFLQSNERYLSQRLQGQIFER
jgi:hypothetical protein